MDITRTLTRRTLLRTAALGGATLLGAGLLPRLGSVLAESGPGQYTCDYNGVRLRDNYGLSSKTIGTLNVGDVVNLTGDSVTADGYTWIPVTVNGSGTAGWTALEFFSPVLGTIIWPAGTEVHVASDDVNLRSGPGLSYGVIGTYDSGTTATIVAGPEESDGYSWHKINIEGTTGWMATNFLTEGAGDGGSDSGWAPGTTVHVTSDNVNMRSGAGLGRSVIASFSEGSTGTVTAGPFPADGYTWYEVRIDSAAGYMASDFLAEGTGNGGDDGSIGATMHVATDGLNLRSGPATSASIIMTLTSGSVVVIADGPVSADGHTWYKVTLSGRSGSGWVAGEYLAPGTGGAEPTGSRRRVVDGPLNLRAGGGLHYNVVASLPTGTVVVIKDASFGQADGYTWMWVYVEGDPATVGWIAQGFTKEI